MEVTEVIRSMRLNPVQKPSRAYSSTNNTQLSIPGEVKDIIETYSPQKQFSLCKNKELCFFGDSPTIIDMSIKYGYKMPLIWLVGQLTDLISFTNCKNVINENQIKDLAKMIASEYEQFKLTEMMLFFYRFKCGEYLNFYGSVSPVSIMKSLRIFYRERSEAYHAHNAAINVKKLEEGKKGCITYPEWLKIKETYSKQKNNEN